MASPVLKLAKCSFIKPIVVVLGATGVGKSKLAIEVASKFEGEIINADAMQVYQGLDIVTNKVTKEERDLCPHHLLDCISPLKFMYNVTDYQTSALKILDDIHGRGKLPVIVGGTNYYIESLLWDFVLQTNYTTGSKDSSDENELIDLSLSQKSLHDSLMEIDPERAKRIHPSDIRKVKRALQVFKQTGRTMSSILSEQQGRNRSPDGLSGPMRYLNSCMIWVQCNQEVLDKRIEKRVDSMVEMGLLRELINFHEEYNRSRISLNRDSNYEHGVFQSIGFKEFHKYLIMNEEEKQTAMGKQLLSEGIENMKLATRQYSKRQVKWIRNRFLRKRGETFLPPVYAVDSTDVEQWEDNVRNPAFEVVESFLKGEEIMQEPLPIRDFDNPFVHNRCPDCDLVFVRLDSWEQHMRGRRHKRTVERNNRLKSINSDQLVIRAKSQ